MEQWGETGSRPRCNVSETTIFFVQDQAVPPMSWKRVFFCNRNLAGMNELNNECKKEMTVPPVSKGEQKGNGCFRPFSKCRVFSFILIFLVSERMHSEARTTWSNLFERPTLRNGLRFFFFRSWGCPVPGCLTNHLRKQKKRQYAANFLFA